MEEKRELTSQHLVIEIYRFAVDYLTLRRTYSVIYVRLPTRNRASTL